MLSPSHGLTPGVLSRRRRSVSHRPSLGTAISISENKNKVSVATKTRSSPSLVLPRAVLQGFLKLGILILRRQLRCGKKCLCGKRNMELIQSLRMSLRLFFLDSCENTDQNGQIPVLMLTQLLPLKLVHVACQGPDQVVLGVRLFFHWLKQLSMKSSWRLLSLKTWATIGMT